MCWRYSLAVLYDGFIVLAIAFLLTFMVLCYRGGTTIPVGTHWYQALLLMGAYLYYMLSIVKSGQTIGLKAWGLRLVFPPQVSAVQAVHRRLLYLWPLSLWAFGHRQKRQQQLRACQAAIIIRNVEGA
ncbi:MAG: RDD family protein [Legionellaceae bacterium]|nr:RDD family protein [Legionellaceae bacterium]